jgi:hypothetical protein
MAKASLDETENHRLDGLDSGVFDRADVDEAMSLVRRITVAMTRLMNYLRSEEARKQADRLSRRRTR